MIETISKYVKRRDILKVARSLLKDFSPSQQRLTIRPFRLDSMEILNFGNIAAHEEEGYGKTTIVYGPRGSGKSWYLEAPLWLLTNACKTKSDVAGDAGDEASGTLRFSTNGSNGSKYSIFRKAVKGKNTVELRNLDEDDTISKAIHGTNKEIKDIVGLDIDLFTSTLFYSPRFSFKFSQKQPHEIEQLIIRVLNLDEWLELEKHAKEIRSAEAERINELNGVIGYVTKKGLTRKEIETKVEELKAERAEIRADTKKIEMPDIKELNVKRNDAAAELREYEKVAGEISDHEGKAVLLGNRRSEEQKLSADIVSQGNEIAALGFDQKTHDALEDELDDLQTDGKVLRTKLANHEKMRTSGECPILKCACDKLVQRNDEVEKRIVELNASLNGKRGQYKKKQEQLTASGKEMRKHTQLTLEISGAREKMTSAKQEIQRLETLVGKTDVAALRKKLSAMPPKNVLERKVSTLENEISGMQKTIRERQRERERLIRDEALVEHKIGSLQEDIEELKKVKHYEEERDGLTLRQEIIDGLIPLFGKKGIPKFEAKNGGKRLTKRMNAMLDLISNHTIQVKLDEFFVMNVDIKGKKKKFTIETVCDGEEHLINMSFVFALAQEISRGKVVPAFIADDVLRSQGDDEDARHVIEGFLHMQKTGQVKQLLMSSSRKVILKYRNDVDMLVRCRDGKLTAK